MRVAGVLDLFDQFANQRAIIDGLGVQALLFAGVNLGKIVSVQAHGFPDALRFEMGLSPDHCVFWRAGTS